MSNEFTDFNCKLDKVESLETFFAKEYGEDGKCRPCHLFPLASLYLKVLIDGNETELGKKLEEAYEEGDILTIAKTMDIIKGSARLDIKKSLESLNCMAQS